MATSADGSVVVGRGADAAGRRAFIWTSDAEMRDLRDVLVNSHGLDLSGWKLTEAVGISADGHVICGNGINPEGLREAWVASLGLCPAEFNGSGAINSQDFFDFLIAFFNAAPASDFNGDTQINSEDFFEFLKAFFAGC